MFQASAQDSYKSNELNFSDRKKRMFTFLHEHPVGVLSTVTPDGDPHGVVIYFQINPDFTVSFLTKVGTRKYDNLMHNDHVMLTVFEPVTQTTLQISGRVKPLKDTDKVHDLAKNILKISAQSSEAGTPPISKLISGHYAALTIQPVQVRMAVYDRPDSGDYGQIFESVESFELNDDF